MIVRAVKRSMDEPKKEDVTNAVIDLIDIWIHRNFGDVMDDDNYETIKAGMGNVNFPVLIKIMNLTKDIMKGQSPVVPELMNILFGCVLSLMPIANIIEKALTAFGFPRIA